MHCEIKSMSPGLVLYNWLIVRNAQKKNITHLPFKFADLLNLSSLASSLLTKHGSSGTLMSKRRKYPAASADDCFNFSRYDDDFEELAKCFQPKNTVRVG